MEGVFNSISQFLESNPMITVIISIIGLIISFVGIVFAYVRIRIMCQKHKMDKQEFNNKKEKFSVFIIDYYRLSYKSIQNVHILFNIKILNQSQSRNTVYPTLRVHYKDNMTERTIDLSHAPELFNEKMHPQIDRLGKDIQLDSNDIKSGWVIFNLPNFLLTKRIEQYEIVIKDGKNNTSNSSCLLVKEIHYED
jgi:hypothetical protein